LCESDFHRGVNSQKEDDKERELWGLVGGGGKRVTGKKEIGRTDRGMRPGVRAFLPLIRERMRDGTMSRTHQRSCGKGRGGKREKDEGYWGRGKLESLPGGPERVRHEHELC